MAPLLKVKERIVGPSGVYNANGCRSLRLLAA